MANSITTNISRQKMVKARSGDVPLAKITHVAFGDGGVDNENKPIQPNGNDNVLRHELLRKPIDGHTYPTLTTCKYSCRLSKADLSNKNINEIALVDADGDLIAIKTFTNKGKEDDMEMVFEIDDEF